MSFKELAKKKRGEKRWMEGLVGGNGRGYSMNGRALVDDMADMCDSICEDLSLKKPVGGSDTLYRYHHGVDESGNLVFVNDGETARRAKTDGLTENTGMFRVPDFLYTDSNGKAILLLPQWAHGTAANGLLAGKEDSYYF
ncbi:MAG: hypothetical protein LBH46_00560 [Rickettsiales bacterium]|jgi:hypothetical protein|nr:hypothetical protein [Rickettsiales bacterium]